MSKIYIVYCYASWAEKNITDLYVRAKTKKEAYIIALEYMKQYNKREGFEYYTEYLARSGRKTPNGGTIYDGPMRPQVYELKTIN